MEEIRASYAKVVEAVDRWERATVSPVAVVVGAAVIVVAVPLALVLALSIH